MAYLEILVAVLLTLMLSSMKSAVQHRGYTDVYVSLNGQDTESCGNVLHPCKSIAKAIHQVDWGGHIYLDGTGTERKPYDCHLSMVHEQQPGINVQKSVSIRGFKSTPHIACSRGFLFEKSTFQAPTIVLSGVVFWQTPLVFLDCDLKIFNCSFQDTSTAVSVHITDNTVNHFNIYGSSFFENNVSCVEITLHEKARRQDRSLFINISETTFLENGCHKQRFTRGAVTVQSQAAQSSNVHVEVSCFNVTFVKNFGYFFNLDLPSAVTSEVYNDVTLFNNTVSDLLRASIGREAHQVVNSLCNSNTKKTRVSFSNLRCSHNYWLRCIKIHSEDLKVEIHNSSFVGQRLRNERGGAMFINSTVCGSVVIFNSRFRSNRAKGGGALFAHSKNGTLTLNITKVNFTECGAEAYACAILVGDLRPVQVENGSGTYKLIANFRDIHVRNCFTFHGRIIYTIRIRLFSGTVAISNSSWQGSKTSTQKALMISNTGGKTNVTMSGCTFVLNVAVRAVVRIRGQNRQASGSITIVNSIISNQRVRGQGTAFWITPNFSINLTNVALASLEYPLLIFGQVPMKTSDSRPFHVSILNCSFLNNIFDIVVRSYDPKHVELIIENTIFKSRQMTRKNVGLYVIIRPLNVLNYSSAFIKIHNVTFESRPCNVLGLLFQGNKTLQIQRSVFRNGMCSRRFWWNSHIYETSTGAIAVLTTPDKILRPGCVRERPMGEIHPVWSYRTHTLFEDNIFEGNVGLMAGAIYISNGYTAFQRCTLLNNFAVEHSGHIYSAYGTGEVNFKDCVFSSGKMNITMNNITFHKSTFLYSESGGPMNLQNTTMMSFAGNRNSHPVLDISYGGYVHMDNNSTIQCPIGSKLLLDNTTHYVYTEQNNSLCRINVTVLKYSCQLCSPGLYSIEKGVSRGLILNSTVKCLECPFGASCIERNIAAKPNFWGFSTSSDPPSLKFIPCPEHYCQTPTSDTQGYNSCKGNRTGTLCGKCTQGYSETLFSAKCRKNAECNNYWFWLSAIILTIALALYLLIKPPILAFLRYQILWFHRREANHERLDLDQNDEHLNSGYIKITFYFYQAAEILMVGSIEDLLQEIPFIYIVIAAFNFQVRTINNGLGCPFVGLTAVTKQLVLSGTVFLSMADMALIYCVHSFINTLRRKEKPPLNHYMAVVMEILLLGYERLAETSLKLMHCVSIGSGKWLFIDANVPCMQWWQYIILSFIVVFVVPFMIVLYFGSSRLHNASITAGEFLAACMVPLPFLIYWLYKEKFQNRREESASVSLVNKDVLEILHGPFRKPNSEDNGTLYWESVLIGRRFILLACQAFITNLMLRMVCMVGACFLMTIHHILKKPYKDPLANKAETVSLAALSMIAVISLTKATLIAFGTAIDGPNRPYLETLDWLEVGALAAVPALFSILVSLAILSQMARLTVFLTKQIVRGWSQLRRTCWNTDQERRPLMNIAEQENAAEH